MLPMSVARSFSGTFTVDRIAVAEKGLSFPTENALSSGKGGWACTVRTKYAIYDFLVYAVITLSYLTCSCRFLWQVIDHRSEITTFQHI